MALRKKTSSNTRLLLSSGVLMVLVSVAVVVAVQQFMRHQALEDAAAKDQMLLERNLAIHHYYTSELRPAIDKLVDAGKVTDFDPRWMSSSYAIRKIELIWRNDTGTPYFYKDAAINARHPDNEADPLEREAFQAMAKDPSLTQISGIHQINGEPFFVTMHRGETLEGACLRCHTTPEAAPPGLVALYGPTRSFGRHPGELVSVVSTRIPLKAAYATADRFAALLSAGLLAMIGGVLTLQYLAIRCAVTRPLAQVARTAREITSDTTSLGRQVEVPATREIADLAEAFNAMSSKLRASHDELENRVTQRTAELARARDDAEAASRAKEQFLAAASHELRTPLTPALLLLSALEDDPMLRRETRHDLATIRSHIETEKRLIGDLLDFSAAHWGKLSIQTQELDLHEVIQGAIDICEQGIRHKDLRLEMRLAATAAHVSGDPQRLKQVFWNLLLNATKFTPLGGRISISSRNVENRIVVEITDSGIGIEPETVGRLFTPFEQGSRKVMQHFGGLGLGLAISRAILDAHGGSITAASEGLNRGATFTVTLPAHAAPAAAAAAPSVEPIPAAAGLQLLLVEDHPQTLQILSRLLKREGHTVAMAMSAAEALEIAETGTFDLVISDIGLPDKPGTDLMPLLKERFGLRGIALTGFGSEADREACRRAGFEEHLAKPVRIETLRQILARFAPVPADHA